MKITFLFLAAVVLTACATAPGVDVLDTPIREAEASTAAPESATDEEATDGMAATEPSTGAETDVLTGTPEVSDDPCIAVIDEYEEFGRYGTVDPEGYARSRALARCLLKRDTEAGKDLRAAKKDMASSVASLDTRLAAVEKSAKERHDAAPGDGNAPSAPAFPVVVPPARRTGRQFPDMTSECPPEDARRGVCARLQYVRSHDAVCAFYKGKASGHIAADPRDPSFVLVDMELDGKPGRDVPYRCFRRGAGEAYVLGLHEEDWVAFALVNLYEPAYFTPMKIGRVVRQVPVYTGGTYYVTKKVTQQSVRALNAPYIYD